MGVVSSRAMIDGDVVNRSESMCEIVAVEAV